MSRNFQFKLSPVAIGIALVLSLLGIRANKLTPAIAQMQNNPSTQNEVSQTSQSLVDVAVENQKFNTLLEAVEAAGFRESLTYGGPFTIFAPTDAAFSELPEGAMAVLLRPENLDLLKTVIAYHIAAGEIESGKLQTGAVDTFSGNVEVEVSEQGVVIDDATVTQSDLKASNGVIHAINKVLLPSDVRSQIMAQLPPQQ